MLTSLFLQAAASLSLGTTSNWTVERSDGSCIVSRAFGAAPQTVTFAFKPALVGPRGEVIIVVPSATLKGERFGTGKGKVSLMPDNQDYDISWRGAQVPSSQYIMRFGVDRLFWESLPTANEIKVDLGSIASLTIELSEIKNPMVLFRSCADEWIKQWGVSPASVVRVPPEQEGAWFPYEAYPDAARRRGEQGRVAMLIRFNQQGAPTKCQIVENSGSETLDTETCSMAMKRARISGSHSSGSETLVYAAVVWRLS